MSTMSAESPCEVVKVTTAQKATIEVPASAVLRLTTPILGFSELSRFVLHQPKPGPLWWLQSTEHSDVAFCVVQPFAIGLDPDYDLGADEVGDLGTTDPAELQVWTLVVLDPDPLQSRTNLRAPILICPRTRKAKQVVCLDGRLPMRQPLLPQGPKPT